MLPNLIVLIACGVGVTEAREGQKMTRQINIKHSNIYIHELGQFWVGVSRQAKPIWERNDGQLSQIIQK